MKKMPLETIEKIAQTAIFNNKFIEPNFKILTVLESAHIMPASSYF